MDACSQLVVDANNVLEFKLVREVKDIEDENCSFGPEMCHQIFGESENIFGYSNLHIRLYYTAASLHTYLGIEYTDKVDPAKFDGIKPDDIEGKLAAVLAPKYTTNIDDFIKCLKIDEAFKPYGELLHSFTINSEDGSPARQFEVYYCEVTTPNFLQFHSRLQTFLLWYVDGASFIDVDDDQWNFFIMFERYKTSEGNKKWAVAGLSTVYRYYAYPMNIRPRISQVLILPPFQRMGLGNEMLEAVYHHYCPMPEVLDITVEDPSEDFQRLRDFYDCSSCEGLEAFLPQNLVIGFSKDMVQQAQSILKINAKQARRIYEILRLKYTNLSDPYAYQQYRLDVKNRLNAPFQKRKNDMKKLQKVLKPEEFAATISISGQEESYQRLNSQYKALEESYRRVINRMENHN